MTSRLALEVKSGLLWLVADVTEESLALLASEQVLPVALPVNTTANRALADSLDIDVWVFLHAHVLLDHLERHLERLEVALVRPVIRPFLEMLLALSLGDADPAEPGEALGALDLRAAAADQRDSCQALGIRTRLSALLHVDLIESGFHQLVLFSDLHHLFLVLGK